MAPIQPWSAAGAEKPMTTVSPASSLSDTATGAASAPVSSSSAGALEVQAARNATDSTATGARTRPRRRVVRVVDMGSPSTMSGVVRAGWGVRAGGNPVAWGGCVWGLGARGARREALLQQDGDHDDRALGDLLDRRVEVVLH